MSPAVPTEAVRPTQLYLSTAKLAGVLEWFDPEDPNYDPLPAFRHGGEWYLADGHTRAFVAGLAGADRLRIERAPVREDHDFAVYRAAIEWCREAGIETIAGLHGRLVGPEEYERLWVDRCRRVTDDAA